MAQTCWKASIISTRHDSSLVQNDVFFIFKIKRKFHSSTIGRDLMRKLGWAAGDAWRPDLKLCQCFYIVQWLMLCTNSPITSLDKLQVSPRTDWQTWLSKCKQTSFNYQPTSTGPWGKLLKMIGHYDSATVQPAHHLIAREIVSWKKQLKEKKSHFFGCNSRDLWHFQGFKGKTEFEQTIPLDSCDGSSRWKSLCGPKSLHCTHKNTRPPWIHLTLDTSGVSLQYSTSLRRRYWDHCQ